MNMDLFKVGEKQVSMQGPDVLGEEQESRDLSQKGRSKREQRSLKFTVRGGKSGEKLVIT